MINVVHSANTGACKWGVGLILGLLTIVQAQAAQITVQAAGNQGFDVYAEGVLVAPIRTRMCAGWRYGTRDCLRRLRRWIRRGLRVGAAAVLSCVRGPPSRLRGGLRRVQERCRATRRGRTRSPGEAWALRGSVPAQEQSSCQSPARIVPPRPSHRAPSTIAQASPL